MAQPSQYQYVQVVGPVFVPAAVAFDPSTLDWLPRGLYPAFRLAQNRLGDAVEPSSEVLYRPEELGWLPSDRYAGRLLLAGHLNWIVVDPTPPAAPSYDPAELGWLPRALYVARQLPSGILGSGPSFEILYRPEGLQWIPSDRYWGRGFAPRRLGPFLFDPFPLVPPYDPTPLDWQPRGQQPARGLRPNALIPTTFFELFYRPEGMQWLPTGRAPGRPLPPNRLGPWVIDAYSLLPLFDPKSFPWPGPLLVQRVLPQILRGQFTIDPDFFCGVGWTKETGGTAVTWTKETAAGTVTWTVESGGTSVTWTKETGGTEVCNP